MANKMTVCKSCGAEIASSAKSCPNCGAKNKKPIYKRAWFIILVILVVLGIGGMAMGGDDEPASDPAPVAENNDGAGTNETEKATTEAKVEYEDVSADQLADDLEANAASAKDKYAGNYYAISGKLGNIDSDGSYIDIDTDDEFDFTIIQCYIKNDAQLDQVKSMSKGDSIVVKGKIKDVGELMGYSIDIDSIE